MTGEPESKHSPGNETDRERLFINIDKQAGWQEAYIANRPNITDEEREVLYSLGNFALHDPIAESQIPFPDFDGPSLPLRSAANQQDAAKLPATDSNHSDEPPYPLDPGRPES